MRNTPNVKTHFIFQTSDITIMPMPHNMVCNDNRSTKSPITINKKTVACDTVV